MPKAHKKKRPRGRPKITLSADQKKQATDMSAVGVSNEQIAKVLKISVDTLVARIGPELESAKVKAIAAVAGKLFQKCMKGDRACIMFYLKCQGRWSEKIEHVVDHSIYQVPQPVYHSPNESDLRDTPEFLKAIEAEIDSELH